MNKPETHKNKIVVYKTHKKKSKSLSFIGKKKVSIYKIKNQNRNQIEKYIYNFYDLNPIIHDIKLDIKLDTKKTSLNKKINDTNLNDNNIMIKDGLSYEYESFVETINNYKQKMDYVYGTKFNLLEKEINYLDKQIKYFKELSEGYARGVSRYISKNFKLPYRVSNAFCKLWEIYSIDTDLLPLKHNPHMFFVAEAPGQWIYSSNHYYKTKYLDKKEKEGKEGKEGKEVKEKLDSKIIWKANSLNPTHPTNLKEFGNVFGDDYGFIKKYPENWLYGKDETGNIFSVENQKWYHDFAKQFQHFDLVTGDAGLASDKIEVLQKLELACLCMIASISSIGSNCIMKHFTIYSTHVKDSEKTNGFFVNMLYLYYLLFDELKLIKPVTSNPNSGEFYVIGKGFRGISEDNYNKLLSIMDNFKNNTCLFDKNEIPESFVKLIVDFDKEINEFRINHKEFGIRILQCLKDKKFFKDNNDCKSYLNEKLIRNIHEKIFKNWIKKTKFTK
jgi:hypothetical protein